MVVVESNITARTERLLIRPLRMDDAEDIMLLRSQSETMKHTALLPSDNIEDSKTWIRSCLNSRSCWNFVVELLHPSQSTPSTAPRVIGMVGAVRASEVGYLYNSNYWGKGYATEALRAFIPLFFDHFSGDEDQRYEFAEAFADPELVTSQKVLRKAGFEFHEKRRNDFYNPVLGWRDSLVYRLYRPDANPTHARLNFDE